jgi:hypothetical protein
MLTARGLFGFVWVSARRYWLRWTGTVILGTQFDHRASIRIP